MITTIFVLIILTIILLLTVVSLNSRLNNATLLLESLSRRLGSVESETERLKRQSLLAPSEPGAPVAEPQMAIEPATLAGRGSVVGQPNYREPGAAPLLPPVISSAYALSTDIPRPPAVPSVGRRKAHESNDPVPCPPVPLPEPSQPALNWEQFMGAKLFAWIGGFVLFLGIAFFIKYSFDRNLIPPAVRAAAGFFAGIGLVAGGVLMKRRELAVTSQTLCATGIVVLYAVTFACRSIYHFGFFTQLSTFVLMVVITAAAFTLAVRLEALVVAILGMAGGFLTPILLSSGVDNPVGLFSYIALLDAGLIAVAFRRRWHFLILLAAAGTAAMELGWVLEHFAAGKVMVALTIFHGFCALFLTAFLVGERRQETNRWMTAAAVGLPLWTLLFALYLLSFPTVAKSPPLYFSFVFGADLCLLALVLVKQSLSRAHLIGGGVVFLILSVWTGLYVNEDLLTWALGLYFGFAVLHTAFPLYLARRKHPEPPPAGGQLFPVLGLMLILIPLLKEQSVSSGLWVVVLLINGVAVGGAILARSLVSIVAMIVLTALITATWVLKLPTDPISLVPMLVVIGGFGLFFFLTGVFAGKRIPNPESVAGGAPSAFEDRLQALFGRGFSSATIATQIPAFAAITPFLLLMMVTMRLPLSNPTPVLGMGLIFVGLLLSVALFQRFDLLVGVGLGCALALQFVWQQAHFRADDPWSLLGWHLVFYFVFTAFPFVFQAKLADRILPWAFSALAGPLHFHLVYEVFAQSFPNRFMGLLPAAFVLPMGLAVWRVLRTTHEPSMRLSQLAWFWGSALFFITLIFPIQFERQWLTVGWALEGLALVALFYRLPHPGLRATGVALLLIAFVRLALNPAIFEYQSASSMRILNWYLYAYGLVTVCLMLAAHFLKKPRNQVWNLNIPPVLYTLGTILAFLLVNVEIADFFNHGRTLVFEFSGNRARDMTYSIAWALFALILLIAGIWRRLPAPRYAAIGLLTVTLVKLFVHDLSQLGQLYRIGAFIIVATILIVASFLYQRFVSFDGLKPIK